MLILVATVYCISVFVAINACVNPGIVRSNSSHNKQGVITASNIEYSHFLYRPHNLVIPAQLAESLPSKKDFSEFSHEVHICQQNMLYRFIQYTHIISNFPVNIRKTDGIFPFHYFW
jgi:hypothetical protein